MTNIQVLTREDLLQFGSELLAEIKKIVSPQQHATTFYKSKEVRKMLKCSDSTLQHYRLSGRLEATKVAGTYYYSSDSVYNFFTKKEGGMS